MAARPVGVAEELHVFCLRQVRSPVVLLLSSSFMSTDAVLGHRHAQQWRSMAKGVVVVFEGRGELFLGHRKCADEQRRCQSGADDRSRSMPRSCCTGAMLSHMGRWVGLSALLDNCCHHDRRSRRSRSRVFGGGTPSRPNAAGCRDRCASKHGPSSLILVRECCSGALVDLCLDSPLPATF